MEGKTVGIITAIIIFIASIAGLYNLNSAQQEQVQQLEIQLQQLKQRLPQTAGAAFPVPIPGYYIAAGENGITGSKIANTSVNDMQLTANAITTNYTTNTTASITSNIPFVNISTGGVIVLNRTSLVTVRYGTQLRSTGDAYMRLMIDGFEQAPGIVFAGNGTGTNNRTALASYTWVNASLLSGSHGYYVQGNVSEGTLILSNATLIGVAYPK